MKEQDIKKLFYAASEGRENDVNSEEIKNAVLEKLGKNCLSNSNVEGEAVEPIFVAPQKKKNKFTALKIVAGTAAVCLGFVVIGNVVYHSNDGQSALSQNASQTVSALSQDASQTVSALSQDATQTVENTAASETEGEIIDTADISPNFELYLLNGTLFKYEHDMESSSYFLQSSGYLLSEENGRLFFVKNAGEIARGLSDKPIKEDITDKISSDDFYIYSYTNPDNPIYQTHYIIIGGDIANQDYGYFELFKVNNQGDWNGTFAITGEEPDTPTKFEVSGKPTGPQWLMNGLKELKEKYGEDTISNWSGSSGEITLDFKNGKPTQGVDYSPKMSDYVYAEPLMDNPDLEFCLLSRSLIQYNKETGTCSNTASMNPNYPLSYKDGRLYYTGNGEKKDITELISDEDCFWTSYINPVTGLIHYIIVGGNIEENDYGYIELFKMYEDDNHWYIEDISTKDHSRSGLNNLNSENASESEWFNRTIDKIKQTLRENNPGKFIYYSGGGRVVDFSE